MYAGWISRDGRVHDYQFTFISSMAINEGLVPEKRARQILQKMLKKLKEEGYDYVYGIPGPLVPVAKEDLGTWEEMTRWGRYENGGLCGQAAYHFIQALYNVGMRRDADEILFTMMATYEREYTHSGVFTGYLQSVDWRTKGGAPTGYNYLADNYYFLLAAVTGYYGVKYPELQAPSTDPAYAVTLYGDRLFDEDWKFCEDSVVDASGISFDDSGWRTLTLPHDFSIERRYPKDDRHVGPFVKGIKDSISTGNIPGGTGWQAFHIGRMDFPATGRHPFRWCDGTFGCLDQRASPRFPSEWIYAFRIRSDSIPESCRKREFNCSPRL